MLERYDAVNMWLRWIYDRENQRDHAQWFAMKLLKCADPRVRCLIKHILEMDRQTVLYMSKYCRN